MTEAVRREPGPSGLSLVLSAWHDPAARILNVDLVAVLFAILLPWSTTGAVIAAVLWVIALVPTLDAGALWRSLKRPFCVLPIAMFALALAGNAVVGRALGRTSLRRRADREIAGAAVAALSFRTHPARRMGVHRLPGVLSAADGGVLAGRFRPQALAEALFLARALRSRQRHRRQELYRPEPGIRAVRGRARLSGADVAAHQQNSAGGAVRGDRAKLPGQHDVRRHFAHGAGDDAGDARGVRADAFAAADGDRDIVRRCIARRRGLERISAFAGHRDEILQRLQVHHDPEQRVRDGFAADLLAEIAAVFRRRTRDRPWHRLHARPVRRGRDRPEKARMPWSSAIRTIKR